MHGPIDYIIVGFEGNKFDGSILRAIADAVDKGIIDIVALSFIQKDAEGTVNKLDIAGLGDAYLVEFTQKYAADSSLVDQADVDEMADLLENNTSAGLLVIEQLWAKPLKKALIDANGVLIAEGRIHPDAAAELEQGKVG
jgi:hypothetical protein